MAANDNNSNDSENIKDIAPKNELEVSQNRENQFIDAFLDCHDVREAGREAGYSETTLNSGYLYQKFKNPRFQEKLRSAAIARDHEDLALIYSLERKGLLETAKQAKDKPETIIANLGKLKHITKQKKMTAGILRFDEIPSDHRDITINIQRMFAQVNAKKTKELDLRSPIADSEIINNED